MPTILTASTSRPITPLPGPNVMTVGLPRPQTSRVTAIGFRAGGLSDWVGGNSDKPPALKPIAVTLDVWGLGKPTVMTFGPGNGVIGLEVDAVKIVGIAEKALEAALECLLRMILKAVLANVQLPFHALTAGAFSLTLLHGPEIDNDQVMLFGTV